jgi:hypothetical protein
LQQEMFKQYAQQWPWPANAAGASADWIPQFQKRWAEFTSEWLSRNRESLETMHKLALEMIEVTSRLYESKSPEEYRRGMDEVRTKMIETFKDQSEAQLRDFQKMAEKWFELLSKA